MFFLGCTCWGLAVDVLRYSLSCPREFFSMLRTMVSCFRLLARPWVPEWAFWGWPGAVPRAANSQSLSPSGMQGLEVAEHLGSSRGVV